MQVDKLKAHFQKIADAIDPPGLRAYRKIQEQLTAPFEAVNRLNAAFKIQKQLAAPFEAVDRLSAALRIQSRFERVQHGAMFHQYMDSLKKLDVLQSGIRVSQTSDFARLHSLPTWIHEFVFEEGDSEPEDSVSPILSPLYLAEGKLLQALIHELYTKEREFLDLKPREFEKIIAELLRSQGFETELTKQTRDGGYDIRAFCKIDGQFPMKFLVECKRYREDRKVGVEIVRAFKQVVFEEGANKGILVATSYFTKDAKDKQQETPWLLDYRDKDAVMKWIEDYLLRSGGLLLKR